MGRGRARGGGLTQGKSQYSFRLYLWQQRLHRGSITTGRALYSVSSVGGKKRCILKETIETNSNFSLLRFVICRHVSGLIILLNGSP